MNATTYDNINNFDYNEYMNLQAIENQEENMRNYSITDVQINN
jgi:hypothetical protein